VPIRELRLATGKSQEKLAALKGDALACTGSYIWKASLRSRPGPLAEKRRMRLLAAYIHMVLLAVIRSSSGSCCCTSGKLALHVI